jgi:putative peptidoglycan lipid II flippase
MEDRKKIIKSAATVGLATSLSRVVGYVRDASLACVLGAGFGMDAFTVAYRLANLFRRLVGEGAMSAAFIPVFVEYKEKNPNEEVWEFARKFFYTLALVVSCLVVLEVIFAPLIVKLMAPGFAKISGKWDLTILLTRIMAPYLLFVALAAFLMGVLNSFGFFMLPALNPVYFNCSVILSAFFLAPFLKEPAVGISIGVLVGGVLQVLTQLPLVMRQGLKLKIGFSFDHPLIRRVGTLLLPSIFGIGIVQINLFVDSLMASFLKQGAVSHLYYADRVMELVLGIFVISLSTVILPNMAKSAASNKIDELKRTLVFSFRATAIVAIPATVGLVILAEPIIHVLFEHGRFVRADTQHTAFALVCFAVGLFFISAVRLIVSAFYSLQDTKTPVKIAVVQLVANIVLNFILMHPLKQGGIALATSLASALGLVLLIRIFEKKHGLFEWAKFRDTMYKVSAASLAMGLTASIFLKMFHFDMAGALAKNVMALFGSISLSVLVYLAIVIAVRLDDGIIFDKCRKLLKRGPA